MGQVYCKLERIGFYEGWTLENPGKNPRLKDENQQQTPPSYDTRSVVRQ